MAVPESGSPQETRISDENMARKRRELTEASRVAKAAKEGLRIVPGPGVTGTDMQPIGWERGF